MPCRDFNKTIRKFFPIAQFDSNGKSSVFIFLVEARDTSLMPAVERNSRSKVDTFLFEIS